MSEKQIQGWLTKHARVLSYSAGSVLITIWTVLRFFTARTIFDLVGQQVVAGQWLHGAVSGTAIGVTNYIPKIFFLYMPLHVLPGSPRLKLLVLTVLMNVATLILLGLILERLLRAFGTKVGGALYVSLIWLGVVAGSVFWIQFANSRNLEVVGGLFLLYQCICYQQAPTNRRLAGIAAFAAILFFADSLQLYMTALPGLIYGLLAGTRERFRRNGRLALGLLAGFLASKAIFWLFAHLFSIQFLRASTHISVSPHAVGQGMVGSFKALVHLYAGGADAGKLREVCNMVFLAFGATGLVYAIRQKWVSYKILVLVGVIFAVDLSVYILSGEAGQASSERYLIMTAPALMLLLASLQTAWESARRVGILAVALLLVVNALTLTRATATASHEFSQDAHIASVHRFVSEHPGTVIYGSMDASLPAAYLYGSDDQAPLPVSCTVSGLRKTNTFYSKVAYTKHESRTHSGSAIVLDGSSITNTPEVCSQAQIIAQVGQPAATTHTDDGSLVLLYNAELSGRLRYQ